MEEQQSDSQQKIIKISPSSLNKFLNCERSYKYQKIDGLVPIYRGKGKITESEGAPLDKGDFIHVLMRIYYKCIILGLKKREAAELAKIFGREKAPEGGLPISISEYLLGIFDEYVAYYIADNWIPIGVEEAFSFILHEDDELIILMEGIIDLEVELKGVGQMSVDHKSASSFGKTQTMGNQFKTYILCKNRKRLMINKIHIQKSVGEKARFSRHIVNIMPQTLADWMEDAIHHIKVLADYLEADFFPRRETACHKYRHQWCEFIPLCDATPRTVEMIARRDYKVNKTSRWDPENYEKRQREELAWIKAHA